MADSLGQPWAKLSMPEQVKLYESATAVITALMQYDQTDRVRKLRETRLKAIREGRASVGADKPGRKNTAPDTKVTLARRMLEQNSTTRQVRAATGLGNSTISRISTEMGLASQRGRRPGSGMAPA